MKKIFLFVLLLFVPLMVEASFDRNLYYGLQNENSVIELQEFLTEQGVYSGPITGNYFSLTSKAVKAFQLANGIISTGYFGPLTRQKANELLTQSISAANTESQADNNLPPKPAATNNDVVKSLQDQIALLLQQISLLQSQQTNVQQLQQTVQQQSQVISQIQQSTQQTAQNTEQVVANTAPATSIELPFFEFTPTTYNNQVSLTVVIAEKFDKCTLIVKNKDSKVFRNSDTWFKDKDGANRQVIDVEKGNEYNYEITCQKVGYKNNTVKGSF